MGLWQGLLGGALWVGVSAGWGQGVQSLRAGGAHDGSAAAQHRPAAPVTELRVRTSVRLTQADGTRPGELWLVVSGRAEGSRDQLTLRIPLSSNQDAYGESRACVRRAGGGWDMTLTAGLDERNFVPFAVGEKAQGMDFLLNKYLCRALAAPFVCGGKPMRLPGDWNTWRLGGSTELQLTAERPAAVDFMPIELGVLEKAFDPKSCPVIAPSEGRCCVGGRETRWHCGGRPRGAGWHQVSGDCFHRETGGTCKD